MKRNDPNVHCPEISGLLDEEKITTHSEMCTRRDRASPLPLCQRPVHLGSAVKTTALLSLRTCSHGGHMKGTIRNRPRTWILPTLPAAEYTPAGWIEGAPGYSTAWRKRLGQRRRRRRAAPTAKRKRALRTGGVAILGAVSAWRAACAQHRASPATKYVIQKKWDM
jgi:hypothetical protein